MEPTVTHDQLLDYAQGRLTPAEMTEISRMLLKDPALQQRYAQLRRLQRLLREHYQPEPVAHPDARDEAVAAMISTYVEAVRFGMAPPTEFAASLAPVPPVESTGSHDALAPPEQGTRETEAPAGVPLPATEPAVPGLAEVDKELEALEQELAHLGGSERVADNVDGEASSEQATPAVVLPAAQKSRGTRLRALVGYSAAAALLLSAAAFSFMQPGTSSTADEAIEGLPGEWMPLVTPPETPEELQRPDATEEEVVELEAHTDDTPPVSHHEAQPSESAQPDAEAEQDTEAEAVETTPVEGEQEPREEASHPEPETGGEETAERPSNGRRPGGVDVRSNDDPAEGDPEADELRDTIRRMADSPPVNALTGNGKGSEVVVERESMRGDLTGNGLVDERDVELLRDALLEFDADELYEHFGPAGDLTGNGRIEVRDLELLRELAKRQATLEHQHGDE